MTFDFDNGEVLLFDKPLSWTSFDLVKKVKGLTRSKKVGHAGTLDPLATGLLILCTGKMTKQIDSYQAMEKEYTGTFYLGQTTESFDREQPVNAHFPVDHITPAIILETTKQFTGIISQFPPVHSAVMVEGKRAYAIARKGKTPELKAREVEIKEFEITAIDMPLVAFRVVCSKGTYIRSLANDFGRALQSGACLHSLCRTRIGSYLLENAWSLQDFVDKISQTNRTDNPSD